MATKGLEGIWGLAQLDETGLATWKLGVMTTAVAGVVAYSLMTLISQMEPNHALPTSSAENDGGFASIVVCVSAGMVFFYLVLARAIERDLKKLALLDGMIVASLEKLSLPKRLRTVSMTVGLLYGFLLFPVVISLVDPRDLTIAQTFLVAGAGGSTAIVCFILTPIHGLIAGIGCALVICQVTALAHAARHIRIDFLQLNDYANIASPGVRLLLVFIPFFSWLLLMYLLADPNDALGIAFLVRILVFGVFVAVLLIAPFAYPVWIMRNRIRDQKAEEIDKVTRALRGDGDAAKAIVIQGLGAPTTTADLLTHRMFLVSCWEWPIASHIQKLILFGLLPPLTWVLAAIIENILY